MKELLNYHISVVYGDIGLSNFWSTFQTNVKYIIFAATLAFMIREWKAKAVGKMVMTFIVGSILFALTLNPETVLQPIGQKLMQMIGA
ncbi:TcpD family membrane protein [Lactococcus lactis]|uniref:TcpD family membrane protein n=1 Tax=Lactococcus lactis TaxID=1358 RepID=UPI0022E05E6F|nr:TcpD family membrane protein [Lactococcus lactis]